MTSDNHPFNTQARAFTLTELLIVIGIMGVLIGLLIPVVGGVRTRAWEAGSRNNLQVLAAAIDAYQRDYDAYPGPLSNDQIDDDGPNTLLPVVPNVEGFDNSEIRIRIITMSENLTLGLMGGLRNDPSNGIVYDPSSVGQGPASLNPRKPSRTKAYLSDSKLLLWRDIQSGSTRVKTGQFADDRGSATDTIIPEFSDGFPSGLPVLYLRARNETRNESLAINNDNNDVIIRGQEPNGRGAFNLRQILGYTGSNIGAGGTLRVRDYKGYWPTEAAIEAGRENTPHGLRTSNILAWISPNPPTSLGFTATHFYPYDAFPYFRDPAVPFQTDRPGLGSPRGKGRYILISPGADRTYGTKDDITSFGRVSE